MNENERNGKVLFPGVELTKFKYLQSTVQSNDNYVREIKKKSLSPVKWMKKSCRCNI